MLATLIMIICSFIAGVCAGVLSYNQYLKEKRYARRVNAKIEKLNTRIEKSVNKVPPVEVKVGMA